MYSIRFQPKTLNYRFEKGNDKRVVAEGNLYKITELAMEQGLSQKELELAYKTMQENKHTVANFGGFGSFLYSTNEAKTNIVSLREV
jgi:hypothetical protein